MKRELGRRPGAEGVRWAPRPRGEVAGGTEHAGRQGQEDCGPQGGDELRLQG